MLLFLVAGCNESRASVGMQFTNADGSTSPNIQAEVVSTPGAQQQGLMYRKELAPTAGMLFVFPDEQPRTFWMKNTYLELDMIFIDQNFRIVSIVKKAVPLTETPRPSEKPAKYVLEVRGGSADTWHLAPGSRTAISGDLAAVVAAQQKE
jgi:uncharacterized membrane protein (UPF0127 family)